VDIRYSLILVNYQILIQRFYYFIVIQKLITVSSRGRHLIFSSNVFFIIHDIIFKIFSDVFSYLYTSKIRKKKCYFLGQKASNRIQDSLYVDNNHSRSKGTIFFYKQVFKVQTMTRFMKIPNIFKLIVNKNYKC